MLIVPVGIVFCAESGNVETRYVASLPQVKTWGYNPRLQPRDYRAKARKPPPITITAA